MKLKYARGITLIALVITVIVLLILAGTAISIGLSGENIFNIASNSRNEWNNSTAKEQLGLWRTLDILEEYSTGVEVVRGEESEWVVEGNSVIKYLGSSTNLIIPNIVGNTKITEIGDNLYRGGATSGDTSANMANVQSVKISSGITTIGNSAFANLTGVNGRLVIPDTVTTIKNGANAFANTHFNNIEINMKNIPSGLFLGNTNITGSVVIGNSVETIGSNAFANCTGLNGTLTIGNNVKTIDMGAFYNCSNLTGDLVIPNGVTTINSAAFSNCSSFDGNLVIPNSVTSQCYSIIQNTGTWNSIEIDITNIPANWANSNGILKANALIIGDNVKTIEDVAFKDCANIKGTFTLGKNIESIGADAFYGCEELIGDVIIQKDNVSIGARCFTGCKKLGKIELKGDGLFLDESKTGYLWGVFDNCRNVTEVIIEGNDITLGRYDFEYCVNLTTASIIGNGITALGATFTNCTALENVIIQGDNITFGSYFFNGCTNLKTVQIPLCMNEIVEGFFNDCNSLTDIYYLGTKAQWQSVVIQNNNTPLNNATIHCTDGII